MTTDNVIARPRVVFLDRIAIRAQLKRPACEHEWIGYPTSTPEQVLSRLAGATVAITNCAVIGEEQLRHLPDLRMIAVAATGYDSIDLQACVRHGVTVTNVRDWSTTAVAEHAFSLMLALHRQLLSYRALVDEGAWQQSRFYGLLNDPLPGDLYGSTLGIVGYGNLGRRIASLGQAFGMRPIIADRKGAAPRPGRVGFEEVLATSDTLCVTCPLNEETRGLIGKAELRFMRPSAIVINCARGKIVDDAALAEALQQGRFAGAGVDVLGQEPPTSGNPLLNLKMPNLIVTPHMAFASKHTLDTLAEQLIGNVEAFLNGQPRNVVS